MNKQIINFLRALRTIRAIRAMGAAIIFTRNLRLAAVIGLVLAGRPFPIFAQQVPSHWKLVWSDEFDYKGLPDSTKWGYDTGGNGWGNNELENYTYADTSNAQVKNGCLFVTARKEQRGDRGYSSARLVTKNKGDWKYGRIEIRALLPRGRGLWPAIWMLPTDWKYGEWPQSGEIDIMEHVDFMKDTVLGTIHTGAYNHLKGTQKGGKVLIKKPYDEFHVYSMEWTPEKIAFQVDGNTFYQFANEHKTPNEWPFDQNFHLLINIAVGGNLGGRHGVDESVFPATMQIDYVRVFASQP